MLHSRTGVTIVYVAATLATEAEVQIGGVLTDFAASAKAELTAIRWVSVAEAEELTGVRGRTPAFEANTHKLVVTPHVDEP